MVREKESGISKELYVAMSVSVFASNKIKIPTLTHNMLSHKLFRSFTHNTNMHTHRHTHTDTHTHTHTHTHARTHIQKAMQLYLCMSLCHCQLCTNKYLQSHIHILSHPHKHTCTHTHIDLLTDIPEKSIHLFKEVTCLFQKFSTDKVNFVLT